MTSLLRKVQFMSFWPEEALRKLALSAETLLFRKNEIFTADDDKYLYVVKSGLLINTDNLGKKQGQYFTSGSFLGAVPFVESRNRLKLSAAVQTSVLKIDTAVIVQIFISDVKLFRAFCNFAARTSLELKKGSVMFPDTAGRILTVSSGETGSGKTAVSALLAENISSRRNTLLIDLSYGGISLSEYFNMRITPPLAEKEESGEKIDLVSRIFPVHDNLSLLNMTNTSKVQLDPGLLTHVLFKLSSLYDCIIIDAGSENTSLQETAFALSDSVVFTTAKKKESSFSLVDLYCNRGQEIFYVNNSHFSRRNEMTGFYSLESLDADSRHPADLPLKFSGNRIITEISTEIFREKSLLVLPVSGLNTVYYAGLFAGMFSGEIKYDYISGGFLTAVNILFYMFSDSYGTYLKLVKDFFRMEKLKVLSEVSYPEKYIYSIDKFVKYFTSVFSSERIEFHDTLLISGLFAEKGGDVFKASGLMSEIAAANMSIDPYFEKTGNSGLILSAGSGSFNIDRWLDFFHIEKIDGADVLSPDSTEYRDFSEKVFKSGHQTTINSAEPDMRSISADVGLQRVQDIAEFSEKAWKL